MAIATVVDGTDAEVDTILVSELFSGDNQEATQPITPVTLEPGQRYILAQGSGTSASKHYVMDSIDVSALEGHPRILAGSWLPANGRAYVWGSSLSGSGSDTPHFPRLGFLYQ